MNVVGITMAISEITIKVNKLPPADENPIIKKKSIAIIAKKNFINPPVN